jgi:hypothetical protein
MRRHSSSERGFSLIIALLVVGMATLMVMGALSFTGTEREAASIRNQDEVLSGCTQMARNMFLSRMRLFGAKPDSISIDAGIGPPGPDQMRVRTGHYSGSGLSGVLITNVERIPAESVGTQQIDMHDITNVVKDKNSFLAGFYRVTATCKDKASGGTEQEVEFMVKFGI